MVNGFFIERILSSDELDGSACAQDVATASQFGSQRRKREYLMWRHIVRRELGNDTIIEYLPSGAPAVVNKPYHIGVSHCRDFAAVCISDKPCAVDIEEVSRDFTVAIRRFATPDELSLSSDPLLLPALWCAKETLYKYSGQSSLDFLKDIAIDNIDLAAGRIWGRIKGGGSVSMSTLVSDGIFAAYIF